MACDSSKKTKIYKLSIKSIKKTVVQCGPDCFILNLSLLIMNALIGYMVISHERYIYYKVTHYRKNLA